MVYLILISVFCLLTVVFNILCLAVKDKSKRFTFNLIGAVSSVLEGVVFIAGQRSGIVIAAGVVLVALGFININNGMWVD